MDLQDGEYEVLSFRLTDVSKREDRREPRMDANRYMRKRKGGSGGGVFEFGVGWCLYATGCVSENQQVRQAVW